MLDLAINLVLRNATKSTDRNWVSSVDKIGESGTSITKSITTGGGTYTMPFAQGYVFFKNLDDMNFVSWGILSATGIIGKLKAGEFALFRSYDSTSTYYFRADTATCLIEITVFEA